MNMTSIGDLAQSLMLRSRSTQLKQTISTLSEELSSGQTSNVSKRLGGDFSYLIDINRNLTRLEGFSVAATEASLFASAAQTSLERLQDVSQGLSDTLISVTLSGRGTVSDHAAMQAREGLDAALSALNSSVGGRSIFSGTATDRAPLGSADTLLSELKTALSGLTSADDIVQAADDWFNDPAGFETSMYGGSSQDLAPMQIGQGQQVTMSLRADDAEFRDLLRDIALTALATDSTLAFDPGVQSDLFRKTGDGLLANQDRLTGLQADLGFTQARIEETSVRNTSAKTGLEYSKGALLEADPYETATRLEEVQYQLESLYSVTVRNAQLSLMKFLR